MPQVPQVPRKLGLWQLWQGNEPMQVEELLRIQIKTCKEIFSKDKLVAMLALDKTIDTR